MDLMVAQSYYGALQDPAKSAKSTNQRKVDYFSFWEELITLRCGPLTGGCLGGPGVCGRLKRNSRRCGHGRYTYLGANVLLSSCNHQATPLYSSETPRALAVPFEGEASTLTVLMNYIVCKTYNSVTTLNVRPTVYFYLPVRGAPSFFFRPLDLL